MKERKEINIQIGDRIKVAREKRGYTQDKFSELVGVSLQYVSDLERGVVGTSIATLIKICTVLHVSSDYILFGDAGNAENSGNRDQLCHLSPEQADIVERGVNLLLEAMTTTS